MSYKQKIIATIMIAASFTLLFLIIIGAISRAQAVANSPLPHLERALEKFNAG